MKKIILLLLIIPHLCFAKSWYQLDNDSYSFNVDEKKIERAIWTKIHAMNVGAVPSQSEFTYHYQIQNEEQVVIWGYCKVGEDFKSLVHSKQRMVVFDGGTCYFTAYFNLTSGHVDVVFNGET